MHEMMAKIVKADELKLTLDEAAKLSKASMRVAEYYDVRMSEKAQAWMALGTVAANIYYPRVVAIVGRKREEKKPKTAPLQPPQDHMVMG